MSGDQFDYLRATSVDHALELLATHPDAELLAGGHSLLARIHDGFAAPDVVVDIGEIDAMQGIETDGEVARIGALTSYTALLDADSLRDGATALVEAVEKIGDTQIRNGGTIGANLVAPDPVAEPPAAVIATDATLVVRGRDGDRRIDAAEFFHGDTTPLAGDELLTHIEVPLVTDGAVSTYVKTQRRTARYSLLGVAVRVHVKGLNDVGDSSDASDGSTVSTARVAANGAVQNGVRLDGVENTLEGSRLDGDSIEAAAARAGVGLDESELLNTPEASASYRAKLLRVYTERALDQVAGRMGVPVGG